MTWWDRLLDRLPLWLAAFLEIMLMVVAILIGGTGCFALLALLKLLLIGG